LTLSARLRGSGAVKTGEPDAITNPKGMGVIHDSFYQPGSGFLDSVEGEECG